MTLPVVQAGSTGAPVSVLSRTQTLIAESTGAMRRVGERLLADLPGAAHATIIELAEGSGTSPATVTRFCRALGFDGYSALRLQIASETGRAAGAGWEVDIGREVLPTDPIDAVANVVAGADVRAIQDTVAQLDVGVVGQVAAAMAVAGRIDVYGIGNSATVARELHLRLHRIGMRSWAWAEVHDGLTSAALLDPGDVALAISHSGRTTETVQMLAEAASHGATTVALTNFARSPLARVADLVLTTAVYETSFRPGSIAARHSQLTVVDVVYVAVAQRTHQRTTAALRATAKAVEAHRVTDGAGPGPGAGSGSGPVVRKGRRRR
jgi:DNA-binding MurR/RpiR family transcriptional regulator